METCCHLDSSERLSTNTNMWEARKRYNNNKAKIKTNTWTFLENKKESNGDTNCNWCAWNDKKMLVNETCCNSDVNERYTRKENNNNNNNNSKKKNIDSIKNNVCCQKKKKRNNNNNNYIAHSKTTSKQWCEKIAKREIIIIIKIIIIIIIITYKRIN